MLKSIGERNIALEWYQHGLAVHDDYFMRFMMHWIAFNWLYNEESEETERERIRTFCKRNFNRLEHFDAFGCSAIDIFL